MENPFQKIGEPLKEVPEGLKKKVMEDISAFKLFSDVVGLFSNNYTKAAESFLKSRRNTKK